MKKSILIIYPHNFFLQQTGIDSRYLGLIEYFKSRDFDIDLFSLTNFETSWDGQDPGEKNLIRNLYLYDFKRGHQHPRRRIKGLKRRLQNILRGYSPGAISYYDLPDHAFNGMKQQFQNILNENKYDFILFSYVHWANLIPPHMIGDPGIILDLSDFTALKLHDIADGRTNIGKLIGQEIDRIAMFREVICISENERQFFTQFCRNTRFHYVPHFMKPPEKPENSMKQHDIFFIGSDNPFNRKGIEWFFSDIYPLLDPSVRILVAGAISDHIPTLSNVTSIPHAPVLDQIYHQAKISICPMLGGSGMKIKVIESLSYGIPVVTTSRGMAGFPGLTETGCLISDSPEGFAENINRLLRDPAFYRIQSGQSQNYFSENFRREKVYVSLDVIFKQVRK